MRTKQVTGIGLAAAGALARSRRRMAALCGSAIVMIAATMANASYYVDMSTWWYWQPQGMTVSYSTPSYNPERILGNHYGVLRFAPPPPPSGDWGNAYLGLTSTTWVPDHTYELSFDVKVETGTNTVQASGYARPGDGPDGLWSAGNLAGIYDGAWHHVTMTWPMPIGYNWLGSVPPAQGQHDFGTLTNCWVRFLWNTGPYVEGATITLYLDNMQFVDLDTATDLARNGTFDLFTGQVGTLDAYPQYYSTSPDPDGDLGTLFYVMLVPEPGVAMLLGATGLLSLPRRNRNHE